LKKQDKDLGIKILSQFSTVTESLKEVHKKACDAETSCDDAFENTKEILKKLGLTTFLLLISFSTHMSFYCALGIDNLLKLNTYSEN